MQYLSNSHIISPQTLSVFITSTELKSSSSSTLQLLPVALDPIFKLCAHVHSSSRSETTNWCIGSENNTGAHDFSEHELSLASFPGSPCTRTKNRKIGEKPGKIYHVRNVTGRENLITCGRTNKLTVAKALQQTKQD